MSKNERKKRTINFIDKITLHKLKWIIVICSVFSLLCEFVPSIFDICKIFNYSSFIVFLQPHKDFFTNIVLGCLGSAVISYIMLLIPRKIKEQEEREKVSEHIKNVASDFLILYSFIEFSTKLKSIEDVEYVEADINERKDNLKESLKGIIGFYEKNNLDCDLLDEIIDITKNKLLFIIKEIDSFFLIHRSFENVNTNFTYPVNIYNDVYKILYDNLCEKYCFNDIKERFIKIVPNETVVWKDLKQASDSIEEYKNIYDSIQSNTVYASKMYSIYHKYRHEKIKNNLEERRSRIIEDVNRNLDSLSYGRKVIEENIVFFVVGDKKMTLDEYKEYCIAKELEKNGMN